MRTCVVTARIKFCDLIHFDCGLHGSPIASHSSQIYKTQAKSGNDKFLLLKMDQCNSRVFTGLALMGYEPLSFFKCKSLFMY